MIDVFAVVEELLAFLNNDLEIITPEWLGELVAYAVRPDVGAVVDVRSRFTHFYRGDSEVARLLSGDGPTHALALGKDGILVTDTTGGRLYRYSTDGTPKQVEVLDLPGRPYGTAYDAKRGRVFITATERNELVQLSLTPAGLKVVRTYPTVRDAYSVAVDSKTGRVFISSEIDSTLQIVDPMP